MRKVFNAYTLVFDNDNSLAKSYGYFRTERKFDTMLKKIQLDPYQDAPLPPWAVKLLTCGELGYKHRMRIAILHHMCITGDEVHSPLARLNDEEKQPDFIEGKIRDWLYMLKEKQVLTNNEGVITCL